MPGTLTRSPVSLSQTPVTTLAGLASALAFAGALPALAQQVYDLDEVVFFYSLSATDSGSTGANVTVITEEELREAGDQQLSSFLSRLPGVSVVQTGPIGSVSDVRIRGAHPRYTIVYIDGIRVNDPSSANGAFAFGTLTTGDIGRIEVLRGSQSARFGAGAVGGVINITTRRATDEGTSGRAFVEAGSYRTLNTAVGFSTAAEQGELSFNLTRFQTRGFSAFDENDGGEEPDGFNATRLSVSGRHMVTDTLSIGASAFAQRSRSEYDDFGADADNVELRREFGARAFAEYELGAHRHVFDVTHFSLNRTNDFMNWTGTPQVDDFRGRRQGASYIGSSPVGEMLTLNYGIDYEREQALIERNSGTTTELSVSESRRGAYAEALFAPAEGLNLSATVRHDRHSVFGGRTTGRLAAAWAVTPALTLRGAASTGYRVPDIPQRFGAFGNPALQPETSRSAEIGTDYAFAGGARVSGTLFYLAARNEIAFNMMTFMSENIEATRRTGFELELAAPLGENIELGAAYTYTNAVITAGPSAGSRISRVPRHDLSLSASARFADRWRAQGSVQVVADRLDGVPGFNLRPLPSYAVVNTSVSYEIDTMTDVTLRVDNLFNRQYQTVETYGTSDRAFYLGLARRF